MRFEAINQLKMFLQAKNTFYYIVQNTSSLQQTPNLTNSNKSPTGKNFPEKYKIFKITYNIQLNIRGLQQRRRDFSRTGQRRPILDPTCRGTRVIYYHAL